MKGIKIKDAALVNKLTGLEKIPVSNGSGQPAAVTINQILDKASGVPIVDSEEKLETLDLPQGSLASVAYDAIKKVSFRDLYQPTMNDLDMNTSSLVNPDALSNVSKLEFTFPEGLQNGELTGIVLVPRTFSAQNQKMMSLAITANDGMVGNILSIVVDSVYTSYIFCEYDENGVPLVNQENIDAFNELLTTDDWCYFSSPDTDFVITEEQFDLIDMFVKGVSGIQGTDLYIKESENFAQLCKKSETEKLISREINKVDKHLQQEIDKVAEHIGIPISYSSGNAVELVPNTYIKHNQTSDLSISFIEPTNSEIANEYILELVCNGNSVTFPESIRWRDNEIPVFTSGTTVIISVINNLAIAATFESK